MRSKQVLSKKLQKSLCFELGFGCFLLQSVQHVDSRTLRDRHNPIVISKSMEAAAKQFLDAVDGQTHAAWQRKVRT